MGHDHVCLERSGEGGGRDLLQLVWVLILGWLSHMRVRALAGRMFVPGERLLLPVVERNRSTWGRTFLWLISESRLQGSGLDGILERGAWVFLPADLDWHCICRSWAAQTPGASTPMGLYPPSFLVTCRTKPHTVWCEGPFWSRFNCSFRPVSLLSLLPTLKLHAQGAVCGSGCSCLEFQRCWSEFDPSRSPVVSVLLLQGFVHACPRCGMPLPGSSCWNTTCFVS